MAKLTQFATTAETENNLHLFNQNIHEIGVVDDLTLIVKYTIIRLSKRPKLKQNCVTKPFKGGGASIEDTIFHKPKSKEILHVYGHILIEINPFFLQLTKLTG